MHLGVLEQTNRNTAKRAFIVQTEKVEHHAIMRVIAFADHEKIRGDLVQQWQESGMRMTPAIGEGMHKPTGTGMA